MDLHYAFKRHPFTAVIKEIDLSYIFLEKGLPKTQLITYIKEPKQSQPWKYDIETICNRKKKINIERSEQNICYLRKILKKREHFLHFKI